MNLQCKPFSSLSALEIYQILQLRSQVFVVEQACVYQDIDNKDVQPQVHHVLMAQSEDLIAYARLLPKDISYRNVSMGRIVIAEQARGKGLGAKLIAHCIKHSLKLWPQHAITIGAQSHLTPLYQKFGFKEVSVHYLEDGIMHVDMTVTEPRYKEFL